MRHVSGAYYIEQAHPSCGRETTPSFPYMLIILASAVAVAFADCLSTPPMLQMVDYKTNTLFTCPSTTYNTHAWAVLQVTTYTQ